MCIFLSFSSFFSVVESPLLGVDLFELVDGSVDEDVEAAELLSVVLLLDAEHRTGLGHVERGVVEEKGRRRTGTNVTLVAVKAVMGLYRTQFWRIREVKG